MRGGRGGEGRGHFNHPGGESLSVDGRTARRTNLVDVAAAPLSISLSLYPWNGSGQIEIQRESAVQRSPEHTHNGQMISERGKAATAEEKESEGAKGRQRHHARLYTVGRGWRRGGPQGDREGRECVWCGDAHRRQRRRGAASYEDLVSSQRCVTE